MTKIYTVAIVGLVVIVAVLTLTRIGHTIDAATQNFMLFYAGVLTLIALCTSVAFGLVSTDRMFLHPGQRVFIQAAHRAASFGAVTFLFIHIVTEILAQRVSVITAVVPFLSPFKTFYIGLGTIAGDILILLAITGIMRGRFNSSGKAWRWRAIHYSSYVAFVFGIWHGLLGGRPAHAYYDWTYGVIIALTFLGLAVRALANSLHPKETLSAPPVAEAANSASAPLRAAAMISQYGATMRGGKSTFAAVAGGTGAQQTMLPAAAAATATATVLPALPAAEPAAAEAPAPLYEPGYEGPQRYMGARRDTGAVPRPDTGAMPRPDTGAMPRPQTGAMPRVADSGPMPASTRVMPRGGSGSGPYPAAPAAPRNWSGPMPAWSGPMPAWSGPMPAMTRNIPPVDDEWGTGRPAPRRGTGPTPAWDEPRQWPGTGPMGQSGMQPQYQDEYEEWMAPGQDQGWGQNQAWDAAEDQAWDAAEDQAWDAAEDQGWDADQQWTGQGQDQGWLEASHEGDQYADQGSWDGYPPEPDDDLRYRAPGPGPGMPGYRGAREQRYGGDRY